MRAGRTLGHDAPRLTVMRAALAWRSVAWPRSNPGDSRLQGQRDAAPASHTATNPGKSARAGDIQRLGWLDVARALAVAATALMHLSDASSPLAARLGRHVVNPGIFGIVLFFLISGFVIPLTLERRGSLGAFAIARVFRLYPLYWFSLLLLMGLHWFHLAELPTAFANQMPSSFWWNVTMAQSWVGQPDAIGLYWTLGYELGFYVASALLFSLGIHRRTDWLVGLGTAYVFTRGVVLPAAGHGLHYDPSETWMISFLVGTLWYRASSQTITWRRAGMLTALFAASVLGSYLMTYVVYGVPTSCPREIDPRGWIFPYASLGATGLAYATFVFLVFTHLGGGSPVLTWLGRISYSVYLIHGLVLNVPLPFTPWVTFGARLVVVMLLSALTYRYIESPPIRWGRALSRKLRFSTTTSGDTMTTMTASKDIGMVDAPEGSTPAPAQESKSATGTRASGKRDTLGLVVAAAIGGAAGYFAHAPATLHASFMNFDKESTPKEVLGAGWSGFEQMPAGDSFMWCMAKDCTLLVDGKQTDQIVRTRLFAYSFPGAPPQTVNLVLNGRPLGSQPLPASPTVLQFEAPAAAWKNGRNELRFRFAYAEAPKAKVPGAEDPRTLSAAFDWVDMVPVVK